MTQNHSLTPLQKIQNGGHHNLTSPYMVWVSSLLSKNITRHHFQVHFDHRQSYKKFEILTENHRLTPLEKNPRWRPSQFDISIYGLDELVATQKHHQTSFPSPFWPETSYKKFKILTQNQRLTPLEKIQDGGCPNLASPYMVRITLISL